MFANDPEAKASHMAKSRFQGEIDYILMGEATKS